MNCEKCSNAKKFVKGGTRKDGSTWDDFWVCESCNPPKWQQKSPQQTSSKDQFFFDEIQGLKDLMNERFNGMAIYLKEQFEKLYGTSFETNSIAKELDLIPVHLYNEYFRHSDEEGWYEWLEEVYDDQFKIEVVPWQQFVKKIRKAFPWVENQHDDFAFINFPDDDDDDDDDEEPKL